MNKTQKKQAIAATLALSLLVGGTFAWQSFSQRITNETSGIDWNIGVRLHNDFNGSDADIYVENYATEEGTNLYTRVRLQEYLEYGTGAGILSEDLPDGQDRTEGLTLIRGDQPAYTGSTPDIDDKATWDIHLYEHNDSDSAQIRDYKIVNYGDIDNANRGTKVYLPTFNRDFDSNDADIKGSLGDNGNRYDGIDSYMKYQTYTIGEIITGEAKYNPQSQVAITTGASTITEEHIAQYTLTSEVMSMAKWIEEEYPIGEFWVYDTDGWAYWAQGLEPQTATGLLVDSITTPLYPDADYYYGLHAVAQTASQGDWGAPAQGGTPAQGMYEDGITEDALYLLDLISGNIEEDEDEPAGIMLMSEGLYPDEMHIGQVEEPVITLEVITLGEHTYYVLDQRSVTAVDTDGYTQGTVDATLLWATESVMTTSYHTADTVSWEASYMRNHILPTWLASQPDIADAVVRVPVVTDGYYLSADSYGSTEELDEVTYDNIFLLSQIEFLATYGLSASPEAITVTGEQWLRSPSAETQLRYIDSTLGNISQEVLLSTDLAGVRPAFWIATATINN